MRLFSGLSARYVVVADSRWIHQVVCSIGRDRFNATYNFKSYKYKPRTVQRVSLNVGGILENAFDPTGGGVGRYGCFSIAWNMTPRGYTLVKARVNCSDFPSSEIFNTVYFPQFALMLCQEFYYNGTLVWVGDLRDPIDTDLRKWPAAPVSPTLRPPDDASDDATLNAIWRGWRMPKI